MNATAKHKRIPAYLHDCCQTRACQIAWAHGAPAVIPHTVERDAGDRYGVICHYTCEGCGRSWRMWHRTSLPAKSTRSQWLCLSQSLTTASQVHTFTVVVPRAKLAHGTSYLAASQVHTFTVVVPRTVNNIGCGHGAANQVHTFTVVVPPTL